MSDCKIYPADTVDATGNVWPTVGENIRNGGFPGKEIKSIDITVEDGVIVNPPSFIYDMIKKENYFTLLNRTAIFAICIKAINSQIRISGISLNKTNGVVFLYPSDSSGIVRVFYYDN